MKIAKQIIIFVCLLTVVAVFAPAPAMASQADAALCTLEIMTGVGAIVWEVRRKMDGFTKCPQYANVTQYCILASEACGHYTWSKGCAKQKLPAFWHKCFSK